MTLSKDPRFRFSSQRATQLAQEEGFERSVGGRRMQREKLFPQAQAEFDALPEDDERRTVKYWEKFDREIYAAQLRRGFDRYLDFVSNGLEDVKLYKLLHECEILARELDLPKVAHVLNNFRYDLSFDGVQ